MLSHAERRDTLDYHVMNVALGLVANIKVIFNHIFYCSAQLQLVGRYLAHVDETCTLSRWIAAQLVL
jgi:hypothetical protein